MTTARALLRRLLAGARGRQTPSERAGDSAGDRLDAARQRLKQTIAPPEEDPAASAGADADDPDGPHAH